MPIDKFRTIYFPLNKSQAKIQLDGVVDWF
jgi:hypothetical protein